ncbi:lysosomal cholesterol signaling protein-like isoform X1 [Entelurus aequoreus]|uniref:lysosomal cholesterol signaling protein-like isoform X1 n=1 Tax=Entelurus aequoreus TaxID=161455 RepID=UPI002B1E7A81|nr:lysosomal cholesterol signaling protein-like isoform X1 [Entelurus aequoreus]XP_061915461.1 lysosomal cholesterol signaling protein-like isoform X1 [Entelurus aequoreus]
METASSYVLIHGKNVSHSTVAGSAAAAGAHMSIDKLFPALLECFGIILCGYIAGRADVIPESQAKGLGNFVSKFALPALLFKNMVLLDFGDIIWSFLWSVLVAKVSVFALVCVLTLMVASPENRYGKAGLYAIFATQSNDFALGYPIVDALYRSTYPEYLQYIYLVAPVSLMLLNPIGFALCEVQRWKQAGNAQQNSAGVVAVVVLQVLKNPIVFMVVVGIASHFALGQRIPAVLSNFIDGLANSFGGAALFYLGLTMVGQLRKLTRDAGVALILLITAKLLVMPLVCKDMMDILDVGVNSTSANHTSLTNFAFLYGVFPTAPSVAIYAGHYNLELEVVTSGMVISTFLSAPIMYVSAWLLAIPLMDPAPLVAELQNVSFNISIVCLVALVWTIVVMLLSRKFNRLPHLFALNLFLAQFLVCVSMILWNFLVRQEDNLIGKILAFSLLYSSLYSTYIWTGLIPLCLALTSRDDLLRLRPAVFMVFGWGVPLVMVGGLLLSGQRTDSIDSAFFYGKAQIISTAVVLAVSLVLGAISLMGLSQGDREQRGYQVLNRTAVPAANNEDLRTPSGVGDTQQQQLAETSPGCSINSDIHTPPFQSVPDMIASTQRNNGNNTDHPGALCDRQQQISSSSEHPPNPAAAKRGSADDDKQTVRHVLLSLLLIVSLLANLSSCLWWLFNKDPGRLYLELQFFCAVVNYGQGFLSFGIFGLDHHLIILPFKKRLQGLWRGRAADELSPAGGAEDVRLTCTQFVRYHKEQCVHDIFHTRRCRSDAPQQQTPDLQADRHQHEPAPDPPHQHPHIRSTFLGCDLVDWLIGRGLCAGRAQARRYVTRLQQGGVLRDVTGEHSFREECMLLYHFAHEDETS